MLGATYCSQVAAYTGKSALGNWIVAKICVPWEPPNVAKVQRIPVNALIVVLFLFQLCVFWERPIVAKLQRVPVNELLAIGVLLKSVSSGSHPM